jgi:ATP-dependent helicase/nuclease subunit A
MGALVEELPDLGGTPDPLPPGTSVAPARPPDLARWRADRDAAIDLASRPGAVAATALTDEGTHDAAADGGLLTPTLFDAADTEDPEAGLQKRPRDLDLPPWLKGRYGTAVGRAVHGVLQTVDLATAATDPAAVDAAVAAQCQAEAIPARADQVRELVVAALRSDVVQAAAAAPHWREVYACTPVGDRLLEGYVDLLYRGPDGLVVVDHKTAGTSDPAALDARLAGYRLQGAAYALAVGQATGEPVVRVAFLFLTPSGAIERDLPDLPAAMAEVEGLVRAGQEVVLA